MKRCAMSAAVVLALALPGATYADEPLPAPAVTRFTSLNGRYVVLSDPVKGTSVTDRTSSRVLWQAAGWYRSVFVADDGTSMVTAASNLVPLDAGADFELLGFWALGRKVKSVTLGQVVPNRSVLIRTVSHYAWGDVSGIDETSRLRVTRIDGKVFRFNLRTGEVE